MAKVQYEILVPIRGTRPGIGAVVAMVAASQQWFVLWALNRGETSWRQPTTLASRREARQFLRYLIHANAGTLVDPDHGLTSGCEWKILPEGVLP